MPNHVTATPTVPPARTHAEAAELLRRPFAPGAIGFRAMSKVSLNGQPYAGAQVAAFLNAQSVVQRLNTVVPGRWRQQFTALAAELVARRRPQALPRLPTDHHAARGARRGARRRRLRGPRRDGQPARSPA